MGLPNVVDLIAADFVAESVPCTVLYGPDHMAEHHAIAPRIVIVPTDDTYGAAQYVQQNAFPSGNMADGQNPRPILTRIEGARATIWARGATQSDATLQQRADYDALHALINQFILSLHRANPGNYNVSSGNTTETTRVDRFGYVYVLNFSVNVPIIDIAWPTETGVAQNSTVQLIRPDGTIIEQIVIT